MFSPTQKSTLSPSSSALGESASSSVAGFSVPARFANVFSLSFKPIIPRFASVVSCNLPVSSRTFGHRQRALVPFRLRGTRAGKPRPYTGPHGAFAAAFSRRRACRGRVSRPGRLAARAAKKRRKGKCSLTPLRRHKRTAHGLPGRTATLRPRIVPRTRHAVKASPRRGERLPSDGAKEKKGGGEAIFALPRPFGVDPASSRFLKRNYDTGRRIFYRLSYPSRKLFCGRHRDFLQRSY